MAEKNAQSGNAKQKPIFDWQAPAFVEQKKTPVWYVLIVVVATVLAGFFIWQKSWTSAGVVVAAALAFISSAKAKPKEVSCSIYSDGIVVDDKAYDFDSLKSFWMIYGAHTEARFQKESRFSTHVAMPIADEEDPEQIRLYLAKKLPEEENRGEDISDLVSRWFRF